MFLIIGRFGLRKGFVSFSLFICGGYFRVVFVLEVVGIKRVNVFWDFFLY